MLPLPFISTLTPGRIYLSVS